jgi:hypothetical protein
MRPSNRRTAAPIKENGMNQFRPAAERRLVVDGTDQYGTFAGDAQSAPFVVFDVDLQENIAGPFASRAAATMAMARIKRGATPSLDVEAMLRYSERRYMGEWAALVPVPVLKGLSRMRTWVQRLRERASRQLASS